jgi:thymidine kinase
MSNFNLGYLKLIIGPMFSCKSSTLLAELNRYKYITNNILVINHALDKQRTNNEDCIKTHDNKKFPSLMINSFNELKNDLVFYKKYTESTVILIDEGQFYVDLFNFINDELKNTNKLFIVFGLSSDSNMKPIGDIIQLVPLADEIIKLSAYCIYCKDGTMASFTKLEVKKGDSQILIGGSEKYKPCCRKHFYD